MDRNRTPGVVLPILGIGGVVAVCCVGPVLMGAGLAGMFGWLADLSLVTTVAVILFVGVAIHGVLGWRKTRPDASGPTVSANTLDEGTR